MAEQAIATAGLRKDYGRTQALRGLDLAVRPGEVFGFLGPNGSGKTTTIRILLDLIRPTAGSARVLGLDPRSDGLEVRRRVGYLPGDFLVDGRQSARELLTYLGNLRGGVSGRRIEELAERLRLDLRRTIKTLSRGNRQKVGLVQAFMHEPELMVLDEPTSGLDPFLQQEFAVMAREVVSDGRTIFMSSHVLSEVQQTSDRVGIIRHGRLLAVEDVDALLATATREVEIVFSEAVPAADFIGVDGLGGLTVEGPVLRCTLDGMADGLIKAAARHTTVSITSQEPDLEDYFFHRYADDSGAGRE